jgi:hypothetical protein
MWCRWGVDDAYTFMAQDTAGLASGYVALENMKVSTANRRFRYLDDRVGGCRDLRSWPLFDGFLADGLIDERFHRRTTRCCGSGASCRLWHRRKSHDLYLSGELVGQAG